MANLATDRAASVNQAAEGQVEGTKCLNCPRKKCDAELPQDETTKKVALTIFAESTPHNTEEMSAIGSTMHNRVGHPGYRRAANVDAVLNQTYKGRNGTTYYQYNGYQSDKYKRGEAGNLEPGDCEALKRAIREAENLKQNGVPAKYNGLTSFRTPNLVSASDKLKGTQIGGHYFFAN